MQMHFHAFNDNPQINELCLPSEVDLKVVLLILVTGCQHRQI